ncbi:MAG: glycoside hydrolase family 3 C-terminal domain-containing protein [Lachnospiraceae bacterium]|nr:glycoside hydrolase family 3 C-terminal domain-containing protein [Acetatifactor muris]MCM1218596.1 glycoside hydrolase family 3 C-terminal domain-containing protein [Lachnospiraceae bacterium]
MNFQQVKGIVTGKYGKLPCPEHTALVRTVSAEGMVLLKNNGVLPLKPGNLALFGAGAGGTVYCGTGSGYVFTSHAVTVQEGLQNAGFTLTDTEWLRRCAENEKKVNKADKTLNFLNRKWSGMSILAEEPEITAADLEAAGTGTAVYVLRRNAGEGGDRKAEKGDYYLSDRERANLTAVAAHFAHTVVVLNTCTVDLNFGDEIPGIDALLYMGLGGMESGNALADVLTGKVNPCGRLTDTLAKKYEDYPASASFADHNGTQLHPMYSEGIYVGYRYFDSFEIDPLYPFGYGLSYTDFEMEAVSATADWERVSVTVRVTNTGGLPGKQVVQLYTSAPAGRLEKPRQELKAYAKTKNLGCGESQELVLEFPTEALASFDERSSAWIMEPGNYFLRLGRHSRSTAIAGTITLDAEAVVRIVTDILAADVPLEEIHASVCQREEPQGILLDLRASECRTVENISKIPRTVVTLAPEGLDYVSSINRNSYRSPNFCPEETKVVRNCLQSTFYDVRDGKVTMEEFVASLPDEVLARICTGTLEETPYPVPDRTGKKLKKQSFPQSSGTTTAQYEESLGIPSALMFDGPGGMHVIGCAAAAFPVGMVVAQTWDAQLAQKIGQAFAREMAAFHVTIALCPGMNIHRDPLGGRSFEYYSEDPVLSGLTAAAFTKGVQADGRRGVSIKHFATNNQETERMAGMNTVSPRALREIYLKGFEICVRQAQPMTVMTSYNGLNGVHTSSRRDLVTDLLRGEWGFEGFVMTDWGTESDKVLDLQAGNDIIMGGYRAEKLLDAMRHVAPIFGEDGAVKETVKSSHMGMVKTTLTQWGSFVPEADGKDIVKTTVAAGKPLGQQVQKAVDEGIAKVEEKGDGTRTVTYHGTDRGSYLARGTLQECAMRILNVLIHSAAMDELLDR